MRELLEFTPERRTTFTRQGDYLSALIDAVEDLGILVITSGIVKNITRRRLKISEFKGFTMADERASLIFINSRDKKSAQIFTLIYQLALVLAGFSGLVNPDLRVKKMDKIHRWAIDVAGVFLIPADEICELYSGEPTQKDLNRFARHFKVTRLIIARRLVNLGLMSWRQFRAFNATEKKIHNQRSKTRGKNAEDDAQPSATVAFYEAMGRRTSKRFARMVIAATRAGTTRESDARYLLGTVRDRTFQRLAEGVGAA